MSFPVYTQQLVLTNSTIVGAQVLFTARPGFRTVLRDITISCQGAPGVAALYVVSGSQAATLIYRDLQLQELEHWQGRVALNPGDTVHFLSPGASTQVVVTGYELFLN